jgi:hypothetical protein
LRELDDGAGKVGTRRDKVEVRVRRLSNHLGERGTIEEVVRRRLARAFAEARGRIRLRVEVDEQRPCARLGEAGG